MQVQVIEQQRHIGRVPEFQFAYIDVTTDGFHYYRLFKALLVVFNDGPTEHGLWFQFGHNLRNGLQLPHGFGSDTQHTAIGDIVRQSQSVMPGRPHRYDHGKHTEGVRKGRSVECHLWNATTIRIRRLVGKGPVAVGSDLGTAGLHFLYASHKIINRTRQFRDVRGHTGLHLHRIIILQQDGPQHHQQDGNTGI